MSNILIYGADNCPWCVRAKELCESLEVGYTYYDIGDDLPRKEFLKEQRLKTIPQCFYKDEHIGGYESLKKYLQ